MYNLFVFGRAVSGDVFTDREEETKKLVSNFKCGFNTFIVSPRRWGKTSLVKKAKTITESSQLRVVYVNVQRCRSREEFCERFASAVLVQTTSKMEEWLDNAKSFLSRFSFIKEAFQELVEQCSDVFETKTDTLTAYQMNFLRALADGIHTNLSSIPVIQQYGLGSSSNVAIIKKSLTDKDIITIENKEIHFSDPIMAAWLRQA